MPGAEYQDGSPVFLQKIQTLEGRYLAIRRTRGDGNCFFRSFVFAYMEDLVKTLNLSERNRSVRLASGCLHAEPRTARPINAAGPGGCGHI